MSDPAIGRFISIDPLAEDYVYNSTYAFQENKLGMGVELEGLELFEQRSKDGKSVTLTLRVNPVNSTSYYALSNDQVNSAVSRISEQTNQSFSGKTSNGATIKSFTVVADPEATVNLEFVDTISEVTNDPFDSAGTAGVVQEEDFGNVESGTVFISSRKNFEHGESDRQGKINDAEVGQTGAHEIGHLAGLPHQENSTNRKVQNSENNLMKEFASPNDTNVVPQQRTKVLENKLIKKQ